MRRGVARVRSCARAAVRGLRASPVPTAVSVVTIAVTLVLVGAFALLVENMQALVQRVGSDLRVSVYLEDDLARAEIESLAERVRAAGGVESVETISKQEALRRFEAGVGSRTGLLEALEENPLPASLEITLAPEERTPEGIRRLAASLDGLRGVNEVAYGHEWVEGYARAVELVRGLGMVLGAVFALAAVLIVANTIRLAIYARRDEIEILTLVGASRSFVSAPFLLEGLIQGMLGAGLALVLLYGLFRLVLPGLEAGVELVIGYASPQFLSREAMLGLLGAGAGLGVVGSAGALLGGWRS